MKSFYIGIVSHGHDEYIMNNENLVSIFEDENVQIVIKDNLNSIKLEKFCSEVGFSYLSSQKQKGFGENNNDIFNYCSSSLEASDDDWFLIINPDVIIEQSEFCKLKKELEKVESEFCTIDLYKDLNYEYSEVSLRKFPGYLNILNPLRMKPVNSIIHKTTLKNYSQVEWASGAFLCITKALYMSLKGFDTRYYMYFEDVDICYRARKVGVKLVYLKNVRAVHSGAYKNRNVYSKHFFWYLSSLFRFLNVQKKI